MNLDKLFSPLFEVKKAMPVAVKPVAVKPVAVMFIVPEGATVSEEAMLRQIHGQIVDRRIAAETASREAAAARVMAAAKSQADAILAGADPLNTGI